MINSWTYILIHAPYAIEMMERHTRPVVTHVSESGHIGYGHNWPQGTWFCWHMDAYPKSPYHQKVTSHPSCTSYYNQCDIYVLRRDIIPLLSMAPPCNQYYAGGSVGCLQSYLLTLTQYSTQGLQTHKWANIRITKLGINVIIFIVCNFINEQSVYLVLNKHKHTLHAPNILAQSLKEDSAHNSVNVYFRHNGPYNMIQSNNGTIVHTYITAYHTYSNI